jgi:uncharacterized protein YdiU (UPF0061 family)
MIKNLYRGIHEFKGGYQPRKILVKDENGDLLADSHNILNKWKNYFSQLLNVHNVSDVRQIEVRTTEPLVPGPNHLEVEIAECRSKSGHKIVNRSFENMSQFKYLGMTVTNQNKIQEEIKRLLHGNAATIQPRTFGHLVCCLKM